MEREAKQVKEKKLAEDSANSLPDELELEEQLQETKKLSEDQVNEGNPEAGDTQNKMDENTANKLAEQD
jgi:hypothetical protein